MSKKPLSETHPYLLEEWDYDTNDALGIFPDRITYGSIKKVGWICRKEECGHSWLSTINNRTNESWKRGCPACNHVAVTDKNNLSVTHPHLLKEWDTEKNFDELGIFPHEVTYGSGKKVGWVCKKEDCKYRWKAAIVDRTRKNPTGCPACTNQVVTDKNNLAVVHPDLVKEWHPTKNEGLKPSDVVRGSNKRVWWFCLDCGYEWESIIRNRTKREKPRGCPECAKGSISKISQEWLDKLSVPQEYREYNISIGDKLFKVDGFCPAEKIVYEFFGDFWHGNPKIFPAGEINPVNKKSFGDLYKETIDRISMLGENGFNVIFVWESDYIGYQK